MKKSAYLQQVTASGKSEYLRNLDARDTATLELLRQRIREFRQHPPVSWKPDGTMAIGGELVAVWVPVGNYDMHKTFRGPLVFIDDQARLYTAGRWYRHRVDRRVNPKRVTGPVSPSDLSMDQVARLSERLREMLVTDVIRGMRK